MPTFRVKSVKNLRRPKKIYTGIHVAQGWAGIPVPGHSQEWRPPIPFPELWEWILRILLKQDTALLSHVC